jgi:hypothetical protein
MGLYGLDGLDGYLVVVKGNTHGGSRKIKAMRLQKHHGVRNISLPTVTPAIWLDFYLSDVTKGGWDVRSSCRYGFFFG